MSHDGDENLRGLLAIPRKDQLVRVLRYVLDEDEFLAPYGIRSISKVKYFLRFTVKLLAAVLTGIHIFHALRIMLCIATDN